MVFVDIPIFGFAKTTQHEGGDGNFSIISPLPFTKAVEFITQNGTSDPICSPNQDNSVIGIFKAHILLSPRKTAAASLLPPPKPAETGISFSISIWTPSVILYFSLKR